MADIGSLTAALELFRSDVGRYPTSEEGLNALVGTSDIKNKRMGGYIQKLTKDHWGNPYQYQYPGTHNKSGFDLWSFAADGLAGGEGFDSDVGNWVGGFDGQRTAMSAQRRQRVVAVLPLASLTGLIFSGSIYLGICVLRLSDGIPRRRSLTGKSIWIALVFFLLYLILVIPIII